MPKPSQRRIRFKLPTRIRTARGFSRGFSPRPSLEDRIAKLPGVNVADCETDKGSDIVRVNLTLPADGETASHDHEPFADIGRDGVAVHGLGRAEKHQILSRGWGKLRKRDVLIYLPRDERELEICWSIIRRAYDRLLTGQFSTSWHSWQSVVKPTPDVQLRQHRKNEARQTQQ